MNRAFRFGLVGVLTIQTLVIAQQGDVARVLAAAREALGGEATLAGVRTLVIEGTRSRSTQQGTSRESRFDMAFGLPDRFMRRDVMASINGMDITRATGFNGSQVIEKVDSPPNMGGHMIFRAPGGGAMTDELTPEEQAAARERQLAANRRDFARLTLGMFAASQPAFPVEFGWVGVAESPDGNADVLDVSGADGFTARLFIDQQSHLPLMLTWMDKEPLTMVAGAGPGGGGGSGVVQMSRGAATSAADMEKMREDMARQLAEAEANRRVVEHRMFYADYKAFDGVRLPTRIQWMVDGQPVEEIALDKVQVNVNIDPKTFDVGRNEER